MNTSLAPLPNTCALNQYTCQTTQSMNKISLHVEISNTSDYADGIIFPYIVVTRRDSAKL